MAQLIVRGLDDDIKRRLQQRAEAGKRSLEAEVR
ncbi:FitA-like ribbon-helix-helix domain-containing protein, partial [Acidisoma sp. 7E03]